MKLLKRIKQYLCNHQMLDNWGLCIKCGWSDPNWSAEAIVKANCPWMDKDYREAFRKQIYLDGKLTIERMKAERKVA